MDKAQADAKAIAIAKAEVKAKAVASSLHVGLGSIMNFNEDGAGGYPVMYEARAMSAKMDVSGSAVTIPQGESVIKSRVTITYSLD
jgi:uncharacterized protein YggE